MDEYNSGMDPEIKQLFRKVLKSFSWGALWLLCTATLGIFFQLGFVADGFRWYNIVFYLVLITSLLLLLRYYYKLWR
jgi:hypothetical protein